MDSNVCSGAGESTEGRWEQPAGFGPEFDYKDPVQSFIGVLQSLVPNPVGFFSGIVRQGGLRTPADLCPELRRDLCRTGRNSGDSRRACGAWRRWSSLREHFPVRHPRAHRGGHGAVHLGRDTAPVDRAHHQAPSHRFRDDLQSMIIFSDAVASGMDTDIRPDHIRYLLHRAGGARHPRRTLDEHRQGRGGLPHTHRRGAPDRCCNSHPHVGIHLRPMSEMNGMGILVHAHGWLL